MRGGRSIFWATSGQNLANIRQTFGKHSTTFSNIWENLAKTKDHSINRLITIVLEGDNDTYGIMSPDLIYESFSKLELSKMDIDDDLISSIEPIVMDTLIVK